MGIVSLQLSQVHTRWWLLHPFPATFKNATILFTCKLRATIVLQHEQASNASKASQSKGDLQGRGNTRIRRCEHHILSASVPVAVHIFCGLPASDLYFALLLPALRSSSLSRSCPTLPYLEA